MAEAKSTQKKDQDKPAGPPRSLDRFKKKVESARGDYGPYVLPIGDSEDTGAGAGNVVITDPFLLKGYAAFEVLEAVGRVSGGGGDAQTLALVGKLPGVIHSLMSERDYWRLIHEQGVSGLVLFEIILDMARHYGINVSEEFDLGELLASLS